MKSKTTRELKWKLCVCRIVYLTRMVHKNWKDLIIRDGMKGKECICHEIDD